jgi:predicted TIM-barrel fold metal-dependent hydrolase
MTLTRIQERSSEQTLIEVRVVDSDIHPVPRPGEWIEHVPEPYRSEFWKRRKFGEVIDYDPPGYAHARAMRYDAFTEDGGFPGSDPELTFRQLILEAGVDLAILILGYRDQIVPEHTRAAAIASNHWMASRWLDGAENWHGRWYGTISVAIQDPVGAAREIEHWAGHPHMAEVMIKAEPRPSWGDPQYDPVWEAATRHGLPVACHVSRGYYDQLPMPPGGPPSYNHDFMTTYSLLAMNQVMSLIFDGVFERFPTLEVVLVEHACTWILPLVWRMDAVYEACKADLPHLKRKPSEYVHEHLRFTTQPLENPEERSELQRLLTWMGADRLLLFSTDYPHWTFDDPKWALRQLPNDLRERIMFQNAIELYGLPTQVPALEGQKRVW